MIETNRFHCIDSDEILLDQLYHDGCRFDLILTDPPYNLNKDFGNDSDSLNMDDFLRINRSRITKSAKLLTPAGSLIWFAIHHFVGYLQVMMYDVGLKYRRMNIWRYENGFSRSTRAPRSEYEPFLWFSASDKGWTFNSDDVRVPYKSADRLKNPVYYRNNKGLRVAWQPNPLGSIRGDIWEFPTLAGRRFQKERTAHPTQKPEALIIEIIKAFCPKDADGRYSGRILDPYAGSGTVGVCCEMLNRQGHRIDWLCAEIEPQWVIESQRRVDAVASTNL
jgi:site-specific DNA-methyltransferase (adenine-specific)